jgi:hypothetical protein
VAKILEGIFLFIRAQNLSPQREEIEGKREERNRILFPLPYKGLRGTT